MSKKRSKKNKGVKNMEEKIITEEPVEEMVEEVTEEPVEEMVEEVTEEPVEEVAEEPVEEMVEEVAEEPVEEMVEEVAEEPVEEGVVIPILLNVRNLANKESEIVRVLNKNDKVKIIGTENDFFIVELSDGLIGYCVKDFIARNN